MKKQSNKSTDNDAYGKTLHKQDGNRQRKINTSLWRALKKLRSPVLWYSLSPMFSHCSAYYTVHIWKQFFNTLRVSVLYTGHQDQKNKWENKAKTTNEQRTKESEFNL